MAVLIPDRARATIYLHLLQDALGEVGDALRGLPRSIAPADVRPTLDELASSLAVRLDQILLPTVAEDLHRHRSTLSGNSEYARYADYFAGAVTEDFSTRFPYVASKLHRVAQSFGVNVCEAVARLGADWDTLQDLLPSTSGRVVSVRSSGADSHDRGRVVLFFDFEGGHSLVYKPRATSPTNLVRHIAQLVPGILATPAGLVRGTHEWAIFVEPGNLDTDEAAQSYYRAIGGLIAAADMLSFTDGHFENVVSALDGPMIVDVETYFHNPTGPLYDAEDAGGILRTSLVRDSAMITGGTR